MNVAVHVNITGQINAVTGYAQMIILIIFLTTQIIKTIVTTGKKENKYIPRKLNAIGVFSFV